MSACKYGHTTGYYSYGGCKGCQRIRTRAVAQRDPTKHRERAYRWRSRNPEKHRAQSLARYRRNPGVCRAWQKANPEKIKLANRLWAKRHPDKAAAKAALRRALLLQRTPPWANRAQIAEFYALARRLTEETGVPHHVDHDVPLKGRFVSGLHVPANLKVITASANHRKSNSFQCE